MREIWAHGYSEWRETNNIEYISISTHFKYTVARTTKTTMTNNDTESNDTKENWKWALVPLSVLQELILVLVYFKYCVTVSGNVSLYQQAQFSGCQMQVPNVFEKCFGSQISVHIFLITQFAYLCCFLGWHTTPWLNGIFFTLLWI